MGLCSCQIFRTPVAEHRVPDLGSRPVVEHRVPHAYMCTQTTHACAHTRACTHARAHTHARTHAHARARTHTHARMHACARALTHARTHTPHRHACMDTPIHTCHTIHICWSQCRWRRSALAAPHHFRRHFRKQHVSRRVWKGESTRLSNRETRSRLCTAKTKQMMRFSIVSWFLSSYVYVGASHETCVGVNWLADHCT